MTNPNPVQGTIGQFNMKIYRTNGTTVSYNVNTTVNYGCTETQFKDALEIFDIFKNYKLVVTREVY